MKTISQLAHKVKEALHKPREEEEQHDIENSEWGKAMADLYNNELAENEENWD